MIGALHARRIKGSIIIGILVATIVGVPLGVTSFGGFSMNIGLQFSDFVDVSLFKMDFAGLFADSANVFQMVFTLVMIVISFSLVDMFDTIGTLLGTAKQANMLDQNGDMPRMASGDDGRRARDDRRRVPRFVHSDDVVESSTGIAEGGRTGLTSLVTSLLFHRVDHYRADRGHRAGRGDRAGADFCGRFDDGFNQRA